jgi:hypothetical protein
MFELNIIYFHEISNFLDLELYLIQEFHLFVPLLLQLRPGITGASGKTDKEILIHGNIFHSNDMTFWHFNDSINQ